MGAREMLWWWVGVGVVGSGLGFNVDVGSRLVHRGQRGTWFGYAVEVYQSGGETWLLSGAPKAQTAQDGVRRGGAVFRCSPTNLACSEIIFDATGHTKALNGSQLLQMDSKSEQWFGATLATSKSGDAVLACAPRYTYFYSKFDKKEPVGTCYLARDGFESIQEFSPCRREPMWGYHRLGFCMAGFSAALTDRGDKALLGAPGAWYWQGALVVQSTRDEDDVRRTEEGPSHQDDTYRGYSIASGDLMGDGTEKAAVGVPRGGNLTGMVSIMDTELGFLRNLTGGQVGEYFGGAVAVGDLDGDGLDDLLVGASLYTAPAQSLDAKAADQGEEAAKSRFEIGKVYVFFQGPDHTFSKKLEITGQKAYSRFGYSLATVGDLNGDGHADFVVGAPYDGPDRRGALYVFHGSKEGIRTEPAQIIFAEDIEQDLRTFGFSVAGGRDVDDNSYPDLIVGAYASDKAVLLRTRPVVSVTGALKVTPAKVNLDDKLCEVAGRLVSCGKFHLCVEYEGKGAPASLELELVISLDAEKGIGGRALFLASDVSRLSVRAPMSSQNRWCQWYDFYVKDGIRDKLNPILIQANYSLVDRGGRRSSQLSPTLDRHVPEAITTQLHIQKNCGRDNVCIPDLQLEASVDKETFVIGADDSLNLDVKVRNNREDAFESAFFLSIPAGLEYVAYKRLSKGLAVTCSPLTETSSEDEDLPFVFSCDLGNPLPKGKAVHFSFEFSTKNIKAELGSIPLKMSVNSSNEEEAKTLEDNSATLLVPMEVEANLVLAGASRPDQQTYSKDQMGTQLRFDTDAGPLVSHVYELRNQGPSSIQRAVLDIYWPSFTQAGHNLLYLLDDPETQGNVQCSIKQQANVNPNSLTVLSTRANGTLLRLRRAAEEGTGGVLAETAASAAQGFRSLVNRIRQLGSSVDFSSTLKRLRVDCSEMHCTQIHCEIPGLAAKEKVLVRVNSRLWLNTLIDEAFYDASVSSFGVGRVTELPFETPESLELPTETAVVTTAVNPQDPSVVRRSLPFWLILIAVLAGITLLILLILALWKCGFFKRTRPPTAQASVAAPPQSEFYGYSGQSDAFPSAYTAPASHFSQDKYGPRL